MPQEAKRHHMVPQFYLNGFAENGLLSTVELPGDHRFTQAVSSAAAENGFYSVPSHPDGSDVFERSLSGVEAATAPILKSMIDGGRWPLPDEERAALALFLTIQFLRGSNHRRAMEQISAVGTRLEIGFGGRTNLNRWIRENLGFEPTPQQADRIWAEATAPDGPPIKIEPIAHIRHLLDMVPEVMPYIAGRPWVLVRFTRRSLLTCDTPVSLIPDPNAPAFAGVGLATAWGVSFPVSRRVGLILASPVDLAEKGIGIDEVAAGKWDLLLEPTTSYERLMNQATISNARRWLYHHLDDDRFVPTELPPARTAEFNVSGASFDFS